MTVKRVLPGGMTTAEWNAALGGPICKMRTKLSQYAAACTEIPVVFEIKDLDASNAYVIGRGGRCGTGGIDTTNDIVTTNNDHNLATGDKVHYNYEPGGGAPTGLTNDGIYYARVLSSTTLNLYDTQEHANAGGATGKVDLSSTGSGVHVFTGWEGNSTSAMASGKFAPSRAGKYLFVLTFDTPGKTAGWRTNLFAYKHNGSTASEVYNFYHETNSLAYSAQQKTMVVEVDGVDDYVFFTFRADANAVGFGASGGLSAYLDIFFLGA